MSRKRLEFFALPDEQRRWLAELLTDDGAWCVLRTFRSPPVLCPSGTEFLPALEFEVDKTAAFSLFLGHHELAPAPLWRLTGAGDHDIDFVRSQAIQFSPAVVARDRVLLEGQLAIMSDVYYVEVEIDPQPLQKWFNRVARSFARLKAPGVVVVQHTSSGTVKKWPGMILTPGAVTWRSEGCQLKQFVNGPVEFDVKSRG